MKIGNEEIIARSMASAIEKDKNGDSVFRGFIINDPEKEKEVRSLLNKMSMSYIPSTIVVLLIANIFPINASSVLVLIIIALNLAYYYKASNKIIKGLEKSTSRKSYLERVRERWNTIVKK